MTRLLLRCVALFIAAAMVGRDAHPQSAEPKVSRLILKEQAIGLAEQILDSLQLASSFPGRVSVLVDGATLPGVVENALLDALQRRGRSGVLKQAGGALELHIVVLEQRVKLDEMKGGMFARSVGTMLDARVEEVGGGSRYLGAFHRVFSDTVSRRESADTGLAVDLESDSMFEKVVEPLIVIAGALLIVYLFFTVRS